MGWIDPPAFAAGDTMSAADWNSWIEDNLQWLQGAAALRLTSGQSMSLSSFVRQSQPFDIDVTNSEAGAHSPLSSSPQITIRTPGLWSVTAIVEANEGSSFDMDLLLNGTTIVASTTSILLSALYTNLNIHVVLALRAGDTLEAAVTCGASVSTSVGSQWTPLLTAVRLGGMFGSADPAVVT